MLRRLRTFRAIKVVQTYNQQQYGRYLVNDKPLGWIPEGIMDKQHYRLINPLTTWISVPESGWSSFTMNPSVTMEQVIANQLLPWDEYEWSQHVNVTIEEVVSHPDYNWHMDFMSRNPNMLLSDLQSLSQPLEYDMLCYNINLTLQQVLAIEYERLDWKELCMHLNVTMDEVIQHPELPWDFEYFSENPNLTIEDVLKYPDYDWDWGYLTRHPNITLEQILTHPELPWVSKNLIENPNVTFEQLQMYPELFGCEVTVLDVWM